MNASDWISLQVLAVVAGTVVLWVVVEVRERLRRRELVHVGLAPGVAETAQSVPTARPSRLGLWALLVAFLGLGAMMAGAWRPAALTGLFLSGGVLLLAFAPLAVYAGMRGGRAGAHATLVAAVVASLVLVIVTGLYGAVLYRAVWSTRATAIQRQLQATPGGREFSLRVERTIGAAAGTQEAVIGGHRAEGMNLREGSRYGMHNFPLCDGTHAEFVTVRPGFLHVYWVPDARQYFVIGEVRVKPSGVVVRDGYIPRLALARPPG